MLAIVDMTFSVHVNCIYAYVSKMLLARTSSPARAPIKQGWSSQNDGFCATACGKLEKKKALDIQWRNPERKKQGPSGDGRLKQDEP